MSECSGGRAGEAEVEVVPRGTEVTLCEVHAAHEGERAVDDADLAVVAIVYLVGEGGEAHGQEGLYLHAAAREAAEITVARVPAAHVVVEQPHVHALGGFGKQEVGHGFAHGVGGEDIGLEIHVAAGRGDGFGEGIEESAAVAEQREVVAGGDGGAAAVVHELRKRHQRAVNPLLGRIAKPRVVEVEGFGVLVDAMSLAYVLPEEIIRHPAHDGQEDKHEDPRHGLGRLPVFEHDNGHGAKYQYGVEHEDACHGVVFQKHVGDLVDE